MGYFEELGIGPQDMALSDARVAYQNEVHSK